MVDLGVYQSTCVRIRHSGLRRRHHQEGIRRGNAGLGRQSELGRQAGFGRQVELGRQAGLECLTGLGRQSELGQQSELGRHSVLRW